MNWLLKFSFFLLAALCSWAAPSDSMDLSGKWRFATDPDDRGDQEKWFEAALPGTDTIRLPGSMQEQGYGLNPGPETSWVGDIRWNEWDKTKYAPYRTKDNFKMPFWLQPEKYYKGPAWYQKIVTIPPSWKNKHITLFLERPHWETRVWVDSNFVGSADFLSVPHTYDLSEFLTPGRHTITIRVDNRMIVNVGPNAHSVSDHTQSNWNGIIGKIELKAQSPVWIEDLQVYPNLENKTVRVVAQLSSKFPEPQTTAQLVYEVFFKDKKITNQSSLVALSSPKTIHETVISLSPSIQTWDEFNPNLYTLQAHLETGSFLDKRQTAFGMRQIAVDGNHMRLNGRRIFLRGTLECCIFPKTGYPPTDVKSWKRIINVCKSHGLNHIRFHSWCPPEAAFIAADEMGFYYQVECSTWPNQGASIGSGTPLDNWLYKEADAILKAYGNHPSFLMLACGNEPAGPENGAVYLRKWISHYKQKDSRRFVTGGSGWPLTEESDYHVTPTPRIQQWGQQLNSRINNRAPETETDYTDFLKHYPNHPIIAHEIGQWCVYPNFQEIKKYTGVLKPKNFEIFRDFLEQKQMLDQAYDFLMASGKLQTLCYKEEVESALRTPDFGGFQLLDLHDFPGQGTALVGVLDPFWDSKPYVSPAEYKRFCDAIVPLARLPKRIFTSSDTLSARVDVSHFGPQDLIEAKIRWSLLSTDGKSLKQGILRKERMPTGDLHPVGMLKIPLSDLPAPAQYKLVLTVEGVGAQNDWDIWIYPDSVQIDSPQEVTITTEIDDRIAERLQKGQKVLLVLKPDRVKTDVKLGFSSIFWNTAWTDGQAPHTLGILCNPKHPALSFFPTEYHSNWQWSEPIRNAAAMPMDHLPASLRPIVQVVPDWFNPQRLGLIFEAKVGKGSLLVCSINLLDNLQERPVIRQLRHSLLAYMASKDFDPQIEVNLESIRSLVR